MVKKTKRSPKRGKAKRKPVQHPRESEVITDSVESILEAIHHENLRYFEHAAEVENNNEDVVPRDCVPITADVRNYDFASLIATQKKVKKRLFDVIMMDPPW